MKIKEFLGLIGQNGLSYRRQIEAPDSTDKEWEEKILLEIEKLQNQKDDPNDPICKHCVTLSICERYDELRALGVIK